jgi:(4S)-4-hydroxy-5-phosphonooxypentane-2,3-dione isomerase
VYVKPEWVEAFKPVTLTHAPASLKEPGVARFDAVQQQDDPTRFVLVEVYRDANAATAHKETKPYRVWRDAVAPMLAEPRRSAKFNNVFPNAREWRVRRRSSHVNRQPFGTDIFKMLVQCKWKGRPA